MIRLDQPNRQRTDRGGPPPLEARVLHWTPPGADAAPGMPIDTAILALTEPVELPNPPCLLPPAEEPLFDAPGRAYGYPPWSRLPSPVTPAASARAVADSGGRRACMGMVMRVMALRRPAGPSQAWGWSGAKTRWARQAGAAKDGSGRAGSAVSAAPPRASGQSARSPCL